MTMTMEVDEWLLEVGRDKKNEWGKTFRQAIHLGTKDPLNSSKTYDGGGAGREG